MKPLLLLLLLTLTLHAQTLTGKVIKVADGDTLTLLAGETKHRIRLYGIDAPEKKQAFGLEAQNFLKKLCANKIATVKVKGTDRYNNALKQYSLPFHLVPSSELGYKC